MTFLEREGARGCPGDGGRRRVPGMIAQIGGPHEDCSATATKDVEVLTDTVCLPTGSYRTNLNKSRRVNGSSLLGEITLFN